MQYMLMCCCDEKAWTQLPESEKHRIMREYGTLIQSLVKSAQFRGGGQLHSTSSATTVRMKGGKLAFTDDRLRKPKNSSGATTWLNAATWTKRSRSQHAFRHSRREARLRCAHFNKPTRRISRQTDEGGPQSMP